jgi:predicted dehydrogenase
MYANQMVFFADSLRDDILPNPGGAEGLVNMLVVDAAYRSAETGEIVKIA